MSFSALITFFRPATMLLKITEEKPALTLPFTAHQNICDVVVARNTLPDSPIMHTKTTLGPPNYVIVL